MATNLTSRNDAGTDREVYTGTMDVGEVGTTTVPVNASVSVPADTQLIAAAATGYRRTLLLNTGTVTVHIAFGETATTAKFPLAPGASLETESLLAIRGIPATGTGTIFVLAEARA